MTYFDLIGIKKHPCGTDVMRQIPPIVRSAMNLGMSRHNHSYAWNDSILLVAYLDGDRDDPTEILLQADAFKRRLDEKVGRSFAIAVKGQSYIEDTPFDVRVTEGAGNGQERFVPIKASSWALANCFAIEEKLGREHKKDWYLDARLATRARDLPKPAAIAPMTFRPDHEGDRERDVYMYKGYLGARTEL